MINLKMDVKLDKVLQRVYDNLPYQDKRVLGNSFESIDETIHSFDHTKVFLGGINSEDIVIKAIPVQTIDNRRGKLNSCSWAPGLGEVSLAEAMEEIYRYNLIPGVLIKVSNVIGTQRLDYFGQWWSAFPQDMQIISYTTVGKTVNTRHGNQGSVVIYKPIKEKIAQIIQKRRYDEK